MIRLTREIVFGVERSSCSWRASGQQGRSERSDEDRVVDGTAGDLASPRCDEAFKFDRGADIERSRKPRR